MLRVIIVDDEPLARQGMRQLLAAHDAVSVVGEARDAAAAAELIRREAPDAVFLDIRMPGADGFDLLAGLERAPRVVFVSAHSEHAIQAFDVDAVDYLLKPVHPDRLAVAIRRLRGEEEAEPYRTVDKICLRTPGRTMIVPVERIVALQADGDFTRVFVEGESSWLICQSIGRYERELPAGLFARLDRSLMINRERVVKTEQATRARRVLWLDGVAEPFELGRAAQSRLKLEKL